MVRFFQYLNSYNKMERDNMTEATSYTIEEVVLLKVSKLTVYDLIKRTHSGVQGRKTDEGR